MKNVGVQLTVDHLNFQSHEYFSSSFRVSIAGHIKE